MNAPPRYIVLDAAPRAKGLSCTADELAEALRAPLATVGVRVVRRRETVTPFSEFQGRGFSRRQYAGKALQVAQIVDEVSAKLRRAREDCMQNVNAHSVLPRDLLARRLTALGLDLGDIEKSCGREWFEGIKRRCIRCDLTGACEADLRRDPTSPVWESYCPNAVRLIALTRL